jgi:glycosyltransferase involved in cell wall biosynthesis
LIDLAKELNISDKTIFTGSRDDMAAAYSSSSSSSSSSSFGEGFSNSVAESMACGTICAVTDVGDSAKIANDPDLVAPPKDPKALAKAIDAALTKSQNEPNLRDELRKSIADRFSLEKMTERTLTEIGKTTIFSSARKTDGD